MENIKQSKTKKELSPFQKLSNLQKRVENYKNKDLPTVKEASHLRTISLAIGFLERQSDATKTPITFEAYCNKHSVNQNTLRKALKSLTGETTKKTNSNSNNIQKYHKEKKLILQKVALDGLESLTEEEREKFEKIKESENKRIEKIREKKENNIKTNKENINGIKAYERDIDSTTGNTIDSKNNRKPKGSNNKRSSSTKGGARNQTSDGEESNEESSVDEEVKAALKQF